MDRLAGYYKHSDNWQNRLIQGDSLLVMNSLLNREGMKGQVQCIYFDPPYGIKYGSNWQMKLNSRDVKDNDTNITGEPEMIKAFRDTWELGIHSYLSYLRDRFVMARELLTESGSIFVQISDDNVHLVRNVLDEVFGSENFAYQIGFRTAMTKPTSGLNNIFDYILWYAKDKDQMKYRPLFLPRKNYDPEEIVGTQQIEASTLQTKYSFSYNGRTYNPVNGWRVSETGLKKLADQKRLHASGTLRFIRYAKDFPYLQYDNIWNSQLSEQNKSYVVQTNTTVIQRCVLMTTDPGDLVLDPTCGSGTTAYVAEQWGRRWITIDTSRIALNIAKKRLLTAIFPFYKTYDECESPNIRQGFKYTKVPHVTLKSIANDMPADEETLYDQPEEDKKRIRVSGPFTVETLQSLDVSSPESLNDKQNDYDEYAMFTERIFNNLKANGIRNGVKQQQAVMHSMEHLDEPYLNARGYYKTEDGKEHCVFFMIGPKFGTVSKHAVNEAVRAFRQHLNESNWLVILGFSFD